MAEILPTAETRQVRKHMGDCDVGRGTRRGGARGAGARGCKGSCVIWLHFSRLSFVVATSAMHSGVFESFQSAVTVIMCSTADMSATVGFLAPFDFF